jgi:hypothetical protein
MFRRLHSNKLYVPLITILGSVALFFAYSFFYVSWQRNYANERAFRLLSVAADQLGKRFENLKSVLAATLVYSTDGSPRSARRDPGQYLKEVGYGDQISVVNYNSPCPETWKREGELALRLLDNLGTFSFQAEFRATGLDAKRDESCFVNANVKFALDLRERFHNLTADYFDDILIATSAGDVLFESNVSGLRITNLDMLVALPAASNSPDQDSEGSGKANKSGRTTVAFHDVSQFSNVRDVKLAGSVYKLYVQPVPLRITDGVDRPFLKTLVCGLWRADRQQSEVVSIPNSTLIWGVLVVLAVFGMVWPLLKVAYMSPTERLKRTHVLYLLSSALFVTTILTVIVLNCAYTVRAAAESREQLEALATQIHDNVRTELARSLALMDALDNDNSPVRALLGKSSRENWTSTRFLESPFFRRSTSGSYPYFDNVFWTDDEGTQLYKLTVRGEATPQTSVKDDSYFKYVRDGRHLKTLGELQLPNGLEISSNVRKTAFRFESRYSPNTGEFFVIIAKPSKRGNLSARFEHLTAQVLVTKFVSLVESVVPAGFGYALVDHDGLVQFHSSEGRNQIEDFFKESRENPVLKALVINGTNDFVDADYNGRRQLLLVRPLEYLADPALTLIVFRDTNYFTTINVACMLVFGLLAGLFILPFLTGLGIYVFRPVAYPLEHLWPHGRNSFAYLQIVVANVCLAATFVIRFPAMEMSEILLALAAIAAVSGFFAIGGSGWARAGRGLVGRAIVVVAIVVVAWRSWTLPLAMAAAYIALSAPAVSNRLLDQPAQSIRKVKWLYLAAVFSLLTVVVVLPCFGLFKISYHSVNRIALEAAERERLDLLTHRAEAITEYFKTLDEKSSEAGRLISEALIRQRIEETLDRYDNAVFWPSEIEPSETGERNISGLEKGIAWAAGWFPGNALGAQLRETSMADADGKGPPWKHAQHDDDEVLVWNGDFNGIVPGGKLKGVYPMWQLPLEAASLMAFLALVLMVWLSYMIRKVFLTDLAEVPPLDNYWVLPDHPERNLLVIGHPKSGKSEWASELAEKDTVDLARVITSGSWTLPKLAHPTVVLDNFAFDMDNPATRLAKLELLEDLIHLRNKRVIVLSTVDLMFYLTASGPEIVTPLSGAAEPRAQILDRWAMVLSSFVKVEMRDRTAKHIDDYVDERNRMGNECPPELVRMIKEECDHTAHLKRLGTTIMDAHQGGPALSKPALVEELLDRADAYYRVLWSTCTNEERLVLFQLARDGWANPKNERAIQQLERRRLVRRLPGLRIMNESFCRFVNAAQLPGEVAKWEEDEQHSAWSALKLGLTTMGLMAGAWLLYTQQNVFQMGIGYVAAMGTASGAVLSLIRSISRTKAGGAAETLGRS